MGRGKSVLARGSSLVVSSYFELDSFSCAKHLDQEHGPTRGSAGLHEGRSTHVLQRRFLESLLE